MNYEDELERARAKRSRKRASGAGSGSRASQKSGSSKTSGTRSQGLDDGLKLNVESGSRAAKKRSGSSSYRRKKKKNNKVTKIVIAVAVAVALLVIAVIAGVVGKFTKGMEEAQGKLDFNEIEVKNPNIAIDKLEEMEKGFWTVAVFGVDSRDNSLGKGNQSDVIMIANLNRETGEIKLVSVFRDSYLNINDKNTYNKINAAYAAGGPEQAVKALNKNLDLNITHYATFNWKAVATVINILGGVEIEVSPAEFHYINAFITETVQGTGIGSTQLKSAGVHNLDGVQAVAYGRLRLMDSDYARTERQRIVISKAFEKLKKANLSTLNDVVGHVFEMSATNISFGDLAGLAKDISKYHLGETSGFPAARGEKKVKIGNSKLDCVIPQTLESNVISLHNFLFGDESYVPSAKVLEISAKIAEISGLATEAEEIGHVAVDKGYVPKKTTAVATEAETTAAAEPATDESGESESTMEGESNEESNGETMDGESGSELESGSESSSAAETNESIEGIHPGSPMGPGSNRPTVETTESDGPRFPGDGTTASNEGSYGPGSIPEATTGSTGGPGSNSSDETIAVRPGNTPSTTNPGGGTTGSTGTLTPGGTSMNTPASNGTSHGPASEATTGAAPGM